MFRAPARSLCSSLVQCGLLSTLIACGSSDSNPSSSGEGEDDTDANPTHSDSGVDPTVDSGSGDATPDDAMADDGVPDDAGGVSGVNIDTSLVFVSRALQKGGSFYWPGDDGPNDMPGVGARSRVRPAIPGNLLLLDPKGRVQTLIDGSEPTGATLDLVDVNAPSVSYDGKTILFAGLPDGDYDDVDFGSAYGTRSVGAWRLYSINVDGSDLKQLSFDDDRDADEFRERLGQAASEGALQFDDYDPVWLPDGRICFASTRWPAFAHYSGQRASNLWVMDADGGNLHRITAERNGADRPTVDPLTGEIVYARWWRNLRYPTNDMTSDELSSEELAAIPAYLEDLEGVRGFDRFLGITRERYESEVFEGDTMFRNAWQIARIRPDGTGLRMFAGYMRSEDSNHQYGGAFTDDGSYFANFFPIINMTESAGFGGIRRYERGAGEYRSVIGVTTALRMDFIAEDPKGNGVPSYGIFPERYAAEATVLPGEDGRRTGDLVVALTAEAGDLTQDYGLYRVTQDGEIVDTLYDHRGSAELRAQVVAPREVPPILEDEVVDVASLLPPPAVPFTPQDGDQSAMAVDGRFTFHALNVYANAPVDVDVVSAMPVGSAKTLRGFADYQRNNPGSFEQLDWPMLIETTEVSAQGEATLNPPANLPLFEDIRDAEGRVPQTGGHSGQLSRTEGAAFVAGMNFGRPGAEARCVGCHTGHTLIEIPSDEDDIAFSNLAPGASVTLSSVADAMMQEAMELSIVNRKVVKDPDAYYQWRSDPEAEQDGQWVQLTFPVPIDVREIVLWNQLQAPDAGNATDIRINEATVVLFADAAAEEELGRVSSSDVAVSGPSRVDVSSVEQPAGVRVVSVLLDDVEGRMYGRPSSSIGEVEVIARGH